MTDGQTIGITQEDLQKGIPYEDVIAERCHCGRTQHKSDADALDLQIGTMCL